MRTMDNRFATGDASFEEWSGRVTETPKGQAIYAMETAKIDLWLQMVEARQAAGLTRSQLAERLGVSRAQVAWIEKRGYRAHSLNMLRRYAPALGEGFGLDVGVRHPREAVTTGFATAVAS